MLNKLLVARALFLTVTSGTKTPKRSTTSPMVNVLPRLFGVATVLVTTTTILNRLAIPRRSTAKDTSTPLKTLLTHSLLPTDTRLPMLTAVTILLNLLQIATPVSTSTSFTMEAYSAMQLSKPVLTLLLLTVLAKKQLLPPPATTSKSS